MKSSINKKFKILISILFILQIGCSEPVYIFKDSPPIGEIILNIPDDLEIFEVTDNYNEICSNSNKCWLLLKKHPETIHEKVYITKLSLNSGNIDNLTQLKNFKQKTIFWDTFVESEKGVLKEILDIFTPPDVRDEYYEFKSTKSFDCNKNNYARVNFLQLKEHKFIRSTRYFDEYEVKKELNYDINIIDGNKIMSLSRYVGTLYIYNKDKPASRKFRILKIDSIRYLGIHPKEINKTREVYFYAYEILPLGSTSLGAIKSYGGKLENIFEDNELFYVDAIIDKSDNSLCIILWDDDREKYIIRKYNALEFFESIKTTLKVL